MAFDSVTTQAAPQETYRAAQVRTYTLRSGDYLSKVADQFCGNPSDWVGIWHATGGIADPNLVPVGLRVTISCTTAGGGYAPAPVTTSYSAPAHASSDGKVWGISYGYPNYCGDGDGDGWDVNCQTRGTGNPGYQQQASRPVAYSAPVQQSYPAVSGGVNWGAIAQCESGNDWSINTGNGFYGGLQFTQQTWDAYGGGQYAGSANQASEGQQIAVAQRVLAGQGIGAWPVCGRQG